MLLLWGKKKKKYSVSSLSTCPVMLGLAPFSKRSRATSVRPLQAAHMTAVQPPYIENTHRPQWICIHFIQKICRQREERKRKRLFKNTTSKMLYTYNYKYSFIIITRKRKTNIHPSRIDKILADFVVGKCAIYSWCDTLSSE